MAEDPLAARAILIVEDEYYAADDLRRELVRLGARVVGPAPTVERAIDLIETTAQIDGAVLDINLAGEMAYPVADMLKGRGVPFLFATGYDQSIIPSRFEGVTRCEKPITPDRLGAAVRAMVTASAP